MTFIFVLLYFTIPVILYKLLKLSNISLSTVSIPSVFFVYYILLAYSGVFSLYFHLSDNCVIALITDKTIIFQMLCYTSICLFLIIGSWFFLSKIKEIAILRYCSNKITPLSSVALMWFFSIFLICCLISYVYISKLERVPIFSLFRGLDIKSVRHARELAGNLFFYNTGEKLYYYKIFFFDIAQYVSIVFFVQALVRRSILHWLVVIFTFVITLFFTVMQCAKFPAISFLMNYFIAYSLVCRNRITIKKVVIFGLVLLLLSASMYSGFVGRMVTADSLYSALDRIVSGGISAAYFYVQYFPSIHEYLYGSSFPNPGNIFPLSPRAPIAIVIRDYIFGANASGSAPTVFWGELYANFGLAGIVLASPIIGGYLYAVQSFLSSKVNCNPIKLALISWCSVHFSILVLSSSGIFFFLDEAFFLILLISMFFMFKLERDNSK